MPLDGKAAVSGAANCRLCVVNRAAACWEATPFFRRPIHSRGAARVTSRGRQVERRGEFDSSHGGLNSEEPKAARQHTNDWTWLTIHFDCFADYCGIAVISAMPKGICQKHNSGSCQRRSN